MSGWFSDLKGYFATLVPPRDRLLLSLEEEARREGIPIVGPVVGELLFLLTRILQARRILELGTATGYSALWLARGSEPFDGRVLTLERNPEMAARARDNFDRAGLAHRIEVQVGEALSLLRRLTGPFDLIFLDLDKEDYLPALDSCERLLRLGGLLVADNVGFPAAQDFNREIHSRTQWRVVSLLCFLPHHSPEEDGLSLAVRVA